MKTVFVIEKEFKIRGFNCFKLDFVKIINSNHRFSIGDKIMLDENFAWIFDWDNYVNDVYFDLCRNAYIVKITIKNDCDIDDVAGEDELGYGFLGELQECIEKAGFQISMIDFNYVHQDVRLFLEKHGMKYKCVAGLD